MFPRGFRYIRSFIPAYGATSEEKHSIISQDEMELEMSEYDISKEEADGKVFDNMEVEGKRYKINEWQAGWNITNAIQV